ncbi:hypothetical protein ABNQ39_06830 [Azospirillum sp. A26]|uniref:hypothetical protein n=1 Tax=Azospirillum sp. A26 TaxID=3160607 RepID=UPI00366B5B2F
MKIDREDTPQSGDGKRTLAADVAKFQSEYASLHERYVGYRFDAAYRREIERLYAELDMAVRSAPVIASAGEAASLIDLEIMLFREFEGEAPVGIHATRRAGLEAVGAFLRAAG